MTLVVAETMVGVSEPRPTRTATVAVNRGLYVIRFAQTVDSGTTALVRQSAGSESILRLISAPGQPEGVLVPGTGLVIRAEASGHFQIIVNFEGMAGFGRAGHPEPLQFQLEPLHTSSNRSANVETISVASAVRAEGASPSTVGLIAHVARRGDLEVANGEWMAGPEAPAQIEGIEVRCQVPGLEIESQVLVAGRWSGWASSNAFLGTRGRALPLTGVRFRLVGPAAGPLDLQVDGLFLGSPIISRRGKEAEVVSSSGVDPLVGLRLSVRESTFESEGASEMTRQGNSSRVRVFRATS